MKGLIRINKGLSGCKTHDTCNTSKHGINTTLLWIFSLWIPAVVWIPLRGNVLWPFENIKDVVHIWNPLHPQTFSRQSEAESFHSLRILLDFSFLLPLFIYLFFSWPPASFFCSYRGCGIKKKKTPLQEIYGPFKPKCYHTQHTLSACFSSHLTVVERAVQSYSVAGEQHHAYVYPSFPPLVPTKQAGAMLGRSSLLLAILCSPTLHKWSNVFVCCFMRSHIRSPPEHCHSLSPLVLYFELLHSSATASLG